MSSLIRLTFISLGGLAIILTSGCMDSEDFAMVAAVAAGTAGGYAGQKGDGAAAADMYRLRDKIVNDVADQRANDRASADRDAEAEQLRRSVRERNEILAAEESARRDADVFIPGTPPPAGRKGMPDPYVASNNAPKANNDRNVGQASGGSSTPNSVSRNLPGVWRNEKATWYFNEDGTARIVIPSLNNQGVATTYIRWRVNETAGTISYTISRMTLEGSDGYDYDRQVDNSYTQPIRLQGEELVINIERLHR